MYDLACTILPLTDSSRTVFTSLGLGVPTQSNVGVCHPCYQASATAEQGGIIGSCRSGRDCASDCYSRRDICARAGVAKPGDACEKFMSTGNPGEACGIVRCDDPTS